MGILSKLSNIRNRKPQMNICPSCGGTGQNNKIWRGTFYTNPETNCNRCHGRGWAILAVGEKPGQNKIPLGVL